MLIKIGNSNEGRDGSDIVDLLTDCHERIRFFIDLAVRLGKSQQIASEEIQNTASRIVRYFSESLPMHVCDEEESILPRLSGRDPNVDAALEVMCREHKEHDDQVAQLVTACRALAATPAKLDELRETLVATADQLQREFLEHLEREEQIVLPALRTILTQDDREAILGEVRARRERLC